MKKFIGYYNILWYGVSGAAIEKRPWGYIARILLPAIIAMLMVGALGAGINGWQFYLFGFFIALLMVCTVAWGYALSRNAPSVAALVPLGHARRTAYFFISCFVFSLLFAVLFYAAYMSFLSLIVLLVEGAAAFTQAAEEVTAAHPAVYLMLAGLAFGNLGMGAMLGYKTPTKSFWLRFAVYLILCVAVIVSLFLAPAMEGAPVGDNIEIDGLAQIFGYLNNPWLFAGIYFSVYFIIFIAGFAYVLFKSRPSIL